MSFIRSSNRLISALSSENFGIIEPFLEPVTLEARHKLEISNQIINHIYFVESGVGSVIAVSKDDEKLEVAIVGREGMTGLAVLHGSDASPHDVFMQIAGHGLRMEAGAFRTLIADHPGIRALFLKYSQASAVQIAHTGLANGRYTINERLARWLLMCQDRVDGNEFTLTHEFLAVMLGVRRPGVTTALHILEGAGIIKSSRSLIKILSRTKLKEQAGGCYGVPEQEYYRLMGFPV